MKRISKGAFSVIGKEGSTKDGAGFVGGLWQQANADFGQVAHLAKKESDGTFAGFWGLMTDFSRGFAPWTEGFSQGLYLAGVEVADDAEAPAGWTKWTAPASEYLCAKIEGDPGQGFAEVIEYMRDNDLDLVGAVYDHNAPAENGQLYMYFPIKRL